MIWKALKAGIYAGLTWGFIAVFFLIITIFNSGCSGTISQKEAGQLFDLALKDLNLSHVAVNIADGYTIKVRGDFHREDCIEKLSDLDAEQEYVVENIEDIVSGYTHTRKLYTKFCPVRRYEICLPKNSLISLKNSFIDLKAKLIKCENGLK